MIIALTLFSCSNKRERRDKNVGFYKIDTIKTNFNSYSSSDYKELTLYFHDDGTFKFSFNVPFIYDSIGTWEVGSDELYEWNYIKYRSNDGFRDQFYQCCDSDSTILLNSITPKKNKEPISKIYFRKVF